MTIPPAKHDGDTDVRGNELCCCPPRARIWIETRSVAEFVENKIDMKRRLMVRADANASVRPPAGPDVNADGSGGSQLDEGTMKDQGKVYRTDTYIVHWSTEGHGDLEVSIDVPALGWAGTWLEKSGQVELARSFILEPPYTAPPPDSVTARILVRDCCGYRVEHSQTARRP
jgi:hypothetical protein